MIFKKMGLLPLLLTGTLLTGSASLHAQSIKVFSRYNYYLSSEQGSIVCALPDSLPAGDYHLLLLWDVNTLYAPERLQDHLLTITPDLQKLPMGTTTLQYRLTKSGQTAQTGSVDIVRLAPKPNTVQVDQLTGGLVVDGSPFFPFGFYCRPVGDLPEREVVHGFNMIGPYQDNLPSGYASRKAYMDRCAQLGVKVQYAVNSLIGGGHNGAKGVALSEPEKLDLLKKEILAFRDHPALLSWYINDEPDGQGRPPEILEAAYKLIHELDPYHPVSVVFMMPARAGDFRHTMDIAMTDPYPIPGPADKVMDDLGKYIRAYRYEKSVWLVPQAFGGQEMWTREPTAQEIRVMTYMGLVSGAKGIQYYTHAAGNLNPQSVSAWSACSDIAVETAQMSAFLLSADPAPPVTSDDPKILARAFRYKGNLLIMAVNNENRPKQLSLNCPVAGDTSLGREAAVWFDNRRVPFNDGHISDMIDAYGTRVYLVRAQTHKDERLSKTNMTFNPGFEEIVNPGLPVGANTKRTSQQKADPGATFFADPGQSVEGMFSLRLITPTDSGGDKIRLLPMVMNKNDSYTVSVWAKARQKDKMPVFRLAIDSMGQSHDFELTATWKRYSFTFGAPSTTTNAILTLELLQQGTAWFDLLQASPDPVIGYTINTDHTAAVTISSSTDNAGIRYAIDKEPTTASPVYRQPIPVTKACTVYAGIVEGDKIIAGSKIFVPVNRALGKPVSFVNPFAKQYSAAGDGSLTDGLMGTTAFKGGNWLGFSGTDMNATVDLQQQETVNEVTTSFLCDPNSGIFLPTEITVYTSADGVKFEPAGKVLNTQENLRGEPFLQRFSIKLKGRPAHYIRVIAKGFGPIPEGYLFTGSNSWLFADEVLVQ
ncbi:MAG TPA: FN3 associated domain-containing protein [Chitinophagaceae bacterium]